jgi:Helicase conserved C-terminal domain
VSIHGGKEQSDRNEAIQLFKDGKKDVLIATDIAAKVCVLTIHYYHLLSLLYVFMRVVHSVKPSTLAISVAATIWCMFDTVAVLMCSYSALVCSATVS